MNTRTLLTAAVALILPQTLLGQGLAIGGRAGTLGFGAEGALELSDQIVARAGIGSFFFDFEGDYDGVDYTVTPPSFTGSLGLDIYPTGGSFRFMAGIMFRGGDFELESGDLSQAGGIEIGDNEYNEAGTLSGSLATRSAAPFLGLGFGRHTAGGFGVFLDLGVAFVGDPDVELTAQGPIASVPGFQQDLDQEVQNVEDDAAPYLKYWPILNLGVKIPLG